MNKEDIIRMAREAEVLAPEGYRGTWMWGHDNLERFAALVVAAEREACAKVVEQTKWSNWFQADCAAAIRARGNT